MAEIVKRRNPRYAFFGLLSVLVAFAFVQLTAHSIDYLGISINPSGTFVGASGSYTVTNPVVGGSAINVSLKYQINTAGSSTTYPKTIDFEAATTAKPLLATDPVITGLVSHIFTSSSSNFTDAISITAPTTPGAYSVRIKATPGSTGGGSGLGAGNGIFIHFTVATPTPPCETEATVLTVGSMCVILHQQATVALTANLSTVGGDPIAGETVKFFVDGTELGTAVTDADGVAVLTNVDVSGYDVGDHDIEVEYAGKDCAYEPTNGSGNLGVQYLFLGFQQPINADGSSQFGGRTIPVKIKLADATGAPVNNADAHVYFAFGTPAVVGTEAEPLSMTNGDQGNLMRYDATANHYIFNWDIAGLANGTYTVRVDLGEGSCGEAHTVVVGLKKKGSK